MPGLLHDLPPLEPGQVPTPSPATHWQVGGKRFTSSAARFWPALLDEIATDFPACAEIRLRATDDQPLHRAQLSPANSLERALERLEYEDSRAAMQEALLELDAAGPPQPISLELRSAAGDSLLCRNLPGDCVDTEIFPFLLVWLLTWAEIPADQWNREFVAGSFIARDPVRGFRYPLELELQNRHLSEGLFERRLTLHCQRCQD